MRRTELFALATLADNSIIMVQVLYSLSSLQTAVLNSHQPRALLNLCLLVIIELKLWDNVQKFVHTLNLKVGGRSRLNHLSISVDFIIVITVVTGYLLWIVQSFILMGCLDKEKILFFTLVMVSKILSFWQQVIPHLLDDCDSLIFVR